MILKNIKVNAEADQERHYRKNSAQLDRASFLIYQCSTPFNMRRSYSGLLFCSFICTRNKQFFAKTFTEEVLKVAISDLRQFLAAEIPLKMMKNAFCFTFKSSFHSQDI